VKKKLAWIIAAMLLAAVLFTPVRMIYKDGGTRTYTALTYKVIVWNTLEGRRGVEFYPFPLNFRSLDSYR